MSRLIDAQRRAGTSGSVAAAATTPAPSRFAAAIAGARAREPITIPRLGLRAILTLIPHGPALDIEGRLHQRMGARGLHLSAVTAFNYEAERALLVLADAVRDPDDEARPFGTLEEWEQVDLDVVAELWRMYGDLRERMDPVSIPLTAEERAEIHDALSKKNSAALRRCGSTRLATWLLTTDAPPSSSPTPRSSSSGTSAASSPEATS